MNVWTLLQMLGRQRVAVGSAVLLTLVAAVLVLLRLEPTYQSTASIALVLSGEQAGDGGPRVLDSSSPQLTANVLAELVSGDTVRQRLQGSGATAAYQATVDETGPLIRVSASGADGAVVIATVEAVMDQISQELQQRQDDAGIPPGARQTAEVLASPLDARPSPEQPGTLTATGSILIVGPSGPAADANLVNPLAQLGRSITVVVAEITTSTSFKERLRALDANQQYQIFPDGQASIIRISSTSLEEGSAQRTVESVITAIDEELAQRQANTPTSGRVTTEVLASPAVQQLPISWLRPTLATVAIGLSSALSLAVLLEGLQAMRQQSMPSAKVRSRLGTRPKGVMLPPEDDDWRIEESVRSG